MIEWVNIIIAVLGGVLPFGLATAVAWGKLSTKMEMQSAVLQTITDALAKLTDRQYAASSDVEGRLSTCEERLHVLKNWAVIVDDRIRTLERNDRQ